MFWDQRSIIVFCLKSPIYIKPPSTGTKSVIIFLKISLMKFPSSSSKIKWKLFYFSKLFKIFMITKIAFIFFFYANYWWSKRYGWRLRSVSLCVAVSCVADDFSLWLAPIITRSIICILHYSYLIPSFTFIKSALTGVRAYICLLRIMFLFIQSHVHLHSDARTLCLPS